jgi:pimeloyl-[acyl-carrier protein] methyl ester esterase
MPWFETEGGQSLWYEDHGTGTPLLFIHGWCMSSAVWSFQLDGLPDSFRIILIDLPGHGRSPCHTDGFTLKECAGDIVSLLSFLNIYGAIVAGWSLGSLIAMETYLLCRERIIGLVLISATPRFVQTYDFPHGLLLVEADGMAKKVRRNIQRALSGFVARMLTSGENRSECVQSLLSSVPVPVTEVALTALEALVKADMRACLSDIHCPTLLAYGDRDVVCLPKASEFMAAIIPIVRMVEFSDCGHAPFLTQSRKFNDVLLDFRGRVIGGEYRQE